MDALSAEKVAATTMEVFDSVEAFVERNRRYSTWGMPYWRAVTRFRLGRAARQVDKEFGYDMAVFMLAAFDMLWPSKLTIRIERSITRLRRLTAKRRARIAREEEE